MDERNSIPPDPKTMAYLLKEFRTEQKTVSKTLTEMNGTLRSICTEISNIKDVNDTQNERITAVEKEQASCTASKSIEGLNARVKRLERYDREDLKDRADASGVIDVNKQRVEAVAMAEAAKLSAESKNNWKALLTPQVVLGAVILVLASAALGGFLLATAFGYVDPSNLSSGVGK